MEVKSEELMPGMRVFTSWSGEPDDNTHTVVRIWRLRDGQVEIAFADRGPIIAPSWAPWTIEESYNAESQWKRLVSDMRRSLTEAEDKPEEKKEDGEDSVDNQIDRYLSDYENEAKSTKTEGKDWRRTVRRIVEAGEDEDEAGGGDELDLGGDEGDDSAEEAPAKLTAEDIDVDSFANSVMRLIENYDSLLEMRNTLLRRASNFLGKNYEPEVVDAFKENLRSEHGIEIGKSSEDVADEQFKAPAAARAGEGGGGGGA